MARSFRDRFFTPPVARAMTSPLGIVLAGVGAAVALVAGLDPFVLAEPWRRYVQASLAAQARYERTVEATPDGPLKLRLADIGTRLQQGVSEVWQVASRGHDIDAGLKTLDVRSARAELQRLDQEPAGSHTAATRDALAAQLATAARLQAVSTDARDRLRT